MSESDQEDLIEPVFLFVQRAQIVNWIIKETLDNLSRGFELRELLWRNVVYKIEEWW